MNGHILWNGAALPFTFGETLAQALNRAGITKFGHAATGQDHSVLCGIGQCQKCLVIVANAGPREACLTLCKSGLQASSIESAHG